MPRETQEVFVLGRVAENKM